MRRTSRCTENKLSSCIIVVCVFGLLHKLTARGFLPGFPRGQEGRLWCACSPPFSSTILLSMRHWGGGRRRLLEKRARDAVTPLCASKLTPSELHPRFWRRKYLELVKGYIFLGAALLFHRNARLVRNVPGSLVGLGRTTRPL